MWALSRLRSPGRGQGFDFLFWDDLPDDYHPSFHIFVVQAGIDSRLDNYLDARKFKLPILYGFFSDPYPTLRRFPENLFSLSKLT